MKISTKLLFSTFMLIVMVLSLNSFTNSVHAKEATSFYKDTDMNESKNLDALLYTNGEIIYQVLKEDDFHGQLYKLNVIDKDGQNTGTYSFPKNRFFNDEYLTSEPVIDKEGNLLISYLLSENHDPTDVRAPYYLASISPTGHLNWEVELGFYGPNSPIFGDDGTIYFIASDLRSGHLEDTSYAYALSNAGEVIWKTELVGSVLRSNYFINKDQNLVFSSLISGEESLQYTLSLDEGRILKQKITKYEISSFFTKGTRYYTDRTDRVNNLDNQLEYTLRADDENDAEIWYYSFDPESPSRTEYIAHVAKDNTVYLTSSEDKTYDQDVSSISNGSLNWTTRGISLYYENNVYILDLLKKGSNRNNSLATISKLDTRNGKAKDTEVLNFNPSSAVAFDNDVILLAAENTIYKVVFDKTPQTGWVKKSNQWLFYNSNNRTLKTGWFLDDEKWYYLESTGIMQTGWYEVNNKWYYASPSGVMQTKWIEDNNKWYFLDNTGVMKSGWFKVGSNRYYANSDGAMQTGWVKSGNTWYFLNDSGAMESGWFKSKSTWYYADSSGAMKTGWVKVNNSWYFLESNGAMKTSWLQQDGNWYYLNNSGAMLTGWRFINNKHYYFYSNGSMAASTTIDEYKLDKSGAWIR